MKIYFKILCLILFATSTFAQNEEHRFVIGVDAGYSLTGALLKTSLDLDGNFGGQPINASILPVLQGTADFSLTKVFSMGIAYSHQLVKLDAEDYSFYDTDNGFSRTETFKTNFKRTQIALRPLFHYGSGSVDMYSGLRIGLLSRGFTDFDGVEQQEGQTSDDLGRIIFEEDSGLILTGNRFSFGLTAFGIRYYFTENIGFGGELNIGAPYIVSGGLSARF